MADFNITDPEIIKTLDALELEIALLSDDAREQHRLAIDAAEMIFHLREALTTVRDNIGVPQPGYPASVAHAYEVACAALVVET